MKSRVFALPLLGLLGACAHNGTDQDSTVHPAGPTTTVTQREEIPAQLASQLDDAKAMTSAALASAYPAPEASALTYDPTTSAGLDLLQASSLALPQAELATLGTSGVVISRAHEFPSFAYGYKSIYALDLPVYVSADSLMDAVHRSYDAVLKDVETYRLISDVSTLLQTMQSQLPAAGFEPQLTADLDLYLGVARSLLTGQKVALTAGGDAGTLSDIVEKATAASGHSSLELFGIERDEDFSQFKPRGHYDDTEELSRYFRAMMWLGRVDLRLIETQSDGSQLFYRRQFDAAVAMRALMDDATLKTWQFVDHTIGLFAGENDALTVTGVDGLLKALGVEGWAQAQALSDGAVIDELARGGWGAQRIASRIIINGTPEGRTLPLDRSFRLFGQRYTVDSHVFVNTTFDRIAGRMMPSPLDVAFGALGNDAALPLLASDLSDYSGLAGALATSRVLVDAHEDGYWDSSLYTGWLGALRTLSPGVTDASLQPTVAHTSQWQRRILNTQLASWAQLRHDTILYVKQSYSSGASCSFPDAYVDPYPEFYARLSGLGTKVQSLADSLPTDFPSLASLREWATNLTGVSDHLQRMAVDQQTGTPHAQAELDFINEAVNWDEQGICGGPAYSNFSGWFTRLHFGGGYNAVTYDPTIADVHTQPTDEAGNDVGRILHVGTGMARLMVVSVDTCEGPRAYAGLASSYAEDIEENWTRLTDSEWSTKLSEGAFPDVPWMSPLFAP